MKSSSSPGILRLEGTNLRDFYKADDQCQPPSRPPAGPETGRRQPGTHPGQRRSCLLRRPSAGAVRRLLARPCRGEGEAKSFAALALGNGAGGAPELAYVTAGYAALAPFGKAATLLSELLPLGGTLHANAVRNSTLRVGAQIVQAPAAEAASHPAPRLTGPVVSGWIVSREERDFLADRLRFVPLEVFGFAG
jgi:hypothetical protein